jgi:acylphosphatase
MVVRKHITLYGNVQGVFLRRTVRHEASRLGLSGFVRNEPDGTVYIEAEGDGERVEQFVTWLRAGADEEGAHAIREADVTDGHIQGTTGFEIVA